MSKLKITDNINTCQAQVQVGQFYKDTSCYGHGIYRGFGHGRIYIVARVYGVANTHEFALIQIGSGECYATGALEIADIFNNDRADFKLIENVEIIVS